MKNRLKFIAKLIIASLLIVPILAFSASLILGILIFIVLLVIIVKLSGGKVNFTINQKSNC
jgi:hypothetical protein